MKQDQKSVFINSKKKSRSGQAVVEYVLLLVVIVGMILGAAKIFKTIDDGMQKYIGDYFVCLMEYGELPTLGIKDSDLKKHTSGVGRTCDNQFDAFSFENGRPATAGGGSGGGGGRGSNSQSANGRNGNGSGDGRGGDADSNSKSDRNADSGSDDSSGGSDLAGRGRGGSGSANRRPEVRKSGTAYGTLDGFGDEDNKTRVLDDDDEGDSARDRRKRRRPKRTRIGYADEYKAIGGRALQEIEKAQRRRSNPKKPTSRLLKIDAEGGLAGPIRKSVVPPDRGPAAEMEDKKSGFSFGSLFKWLLIGGMIIAIIVFFGGQLLNYSNSDS